MSITVIGKIFIKTGTALIVVSPSLHFYTENYQKRINAILKSRYTVKFHNISLIY